MAREEEQALLDLIYKVWTNLGSVYFLCQSTIDISRSWTRIKSLMND